MSLADVAYGANQTIQQLLLQRELQRMGVSPAQLAQRNQAREDEKLNLLRQQQQFNQQRQTALEQDAAQQKAATEANTLGDQLPPGLILSPSDPAAAMMQRGGRAGLLTRNTTLPSTQITGTDLGNLTATPRPSDNVVQSFTKEASQKQIDTNTDNARQAAKDANDLGLRWYEASQRNSHEPTPHYSIQPMYDEAGRPTGAIRFNTLTGEAGPIDLPAGGFLRAAPPRRTAAADDPAFPNGVKDYAFQLRSRYTTLPPALTELQQAWPSIRAAHPNADATKAVTALRQMYAEPAGSNSIAALLGGSAGEGAPSNTLLATPRPPSAPAAAGYHVGQRVQLRDGRTVTIAGVNPDGSYRVQP